jgi:hypothetical protein
MVLQATSIARVDPWARIKRPFGPGAETAIFELASRLALWVIWTFDNFTLSKVLDTLIIANLLAGRDGAHIVA